MTGASYLWMYSCPAPFGGKSDQTMQQIEQAARAIPEMAPIQQAQQDQTTRLGISVVVPVYNEEESVRPLYDALTAQLQQLGQSYEIIFVDDGSRDGSFTVERALYEQDPHVRVVQFRRNFGKTPSLVAGFTQARGDVVFTMDADLQDDPAEIPLF